MGCPRALSQRLAISGRRIQQSPRDLGRPFAVEVLFLPAPLWCLFLAFSYFFFWVHVSLTLGPGAAGHAWQWQGVWRRRCCSGPFARVVWACPRGGPPVSHCGLLGGRCSWFCGTT